MRMAPQLASWLRTAEHPPMSTYPHWLAMASPFVHFAEKEVELLKRWQAEGKSVRGLPRFKKSPETLLCAHEIPYDTRRLAGNLAEGASATKFPWTVGPLHGPCRGPPRGPLYFS